MAGGSESGGPMGGAYEQEVVGDPSAVCNDWHSCLAIG